MSGFGNLAPVGLAVGLGLLSSAVGALAMVLVEWSGGFSRSRAGGGLAWPSRLIPSLRLLPVSVASGRRGVPGEVGLWATATLWRFGIALFASATCGAVLGQALLARPGALLGLAGAILGALHWRRTTRRRRALEATAQLPDALWVLADAFAVGHGLVGACGAAAGWVPAPLGHELGAVAGAIAGGQAYDAALEGLRRRVPTQAVSAVVTTLLVHHWAGGDLPGALRSLATELDDATEMIRDVRTIQAGALASGQVTVLMGGLALVLLERLRPGTLDAVWAAIPGRVALAAGTALVAIGFLVLRRITRVEV